MWVLDDGKGIRAYAGIYKDGFLGFEYVVPDSKRQNIAGRMRTGYNNSRIKCYSLSMCDLLDFKAYF